MKIPVINEASISEWMRKSAEARSQFVHADASMEAGAPGKQFEIVDAELRRAKAKSFVKGIKPLRGLRRNQEAVNESTLAAVRELVVVNRKMACEIEALQNLALVLRQQIVELQSRPEWLLIREASEKRSQT